MSTSVETAPILGVPARHLDGILAAATDFVFAFDCEERFIFYHAPQLDGLYVPPEFFLGKRNSDVMPLRMHVLFAEAMEKNRQGEVAEYEYWLEINGWIRWFSVKMSPIFLDGEFSSSVAVAREITKIKAMQRDLQQTHATLEQSVARRTARLKVLHEIDQAILAVRSPKAIAEVALHHIRRLIPCLGGIISLVDIHPGSILVLAAEINDQLALREEGQLSLEVLAGHDDLLQSLRRGNVHILEDTFSVVQPSTVVRVLKDWNVRALFSVPLVVERQSIGAISLAMETPGPLAPEYADIAKEVANSLAVAIQQSRLLEEARASRSRLRRLTQQIISTQEEERRRLSRALHDQTGQALIALKISLGLIQEDLSTTNFASLHRRLGDAITLATTTMEQIRSLAHDLRPPTLDAAGLGPALEGFCAEFAKHTQLDVVYAGPAKVARLSDAANICLYRFLQEAMTNVVKHADASQVHVTLRNDGGTVCLEVQDDGRGFDEQVRLSGVGWPMGIGLLGCGNDSSR